MTARACVFCGQREVTREHVLPRWLASVLTAGLGEHRHEKGEVKRQWVAPLFSTTARIACRSCNTGWMSRLEGAAKPIVGALVQGKSVVLEPFMQTLVATWAFKTALCLDKTNIGRGNVLASEYRSLGMNRLPAQHCQVWLGRYDWVEESLAANFLSRLDARHPSSLGEVLPFGLWKITFTVGYALFNIIGPTEEGNEFRVDWGAFASMLGRIWPVSVAVSWPDGPAFDSTSFSAMAIARQQSMDKG